MSMPYCSTIQELIQYIDDEELSYRTTHTNLYIRQNNTTIKIPYKSIVREYLPFLQPCVLQAKFSEPEKNIYRWQPKRLSNDLYGTTEIWSALLELNGKLSILDFDVEGVVKLFEPKGFKKLMNEIMIREGILT